MELRMDILRAMASGDEKPTKIMYRANVCWQTLNECLADLEAGSMLSCVPAGSRRRYRLTEKGTKVVLAYEELKEEIRPGSTTRRSQNWGW